MSGSMVEVIKTTPRMGRRSMALADIDPKYVSQSGIWEASEVETSKGSIRIQHLTAVATSLRSVSAGGGATSMVGGSPNNPRFPKLEECAHFHYDYVELPVLKIVIREDTSKSITLPVDDAVTDKCAFAIEVSAGGQSWVIRRTHANFLLLDEQLHRCVWDRSFSRLEQLKESLALSGSSSGTKGRRHQQASSCANINIATSSSTAQCSRRRTTSAGGNSGACEDLVVVGEDADQAEDNNSHLHSDHPDEEHSGCRDTIVRYLSRLAQLPTNKITCGTVLSWLELDNRGRHIVSSDDSDINTPAVAAACAVRKYVAQAADEITFEVGDMISVIDMPPPEESIWWRGKRGFHVGFFPRECVQVIGDKVPAGLPIVSSVRRLQRLSVSSTPSSSSSSAPEKPVLRKHGKLIAFFRSFILSRPSRRRLKQSGILRERVFSCDLAEHLLNTGNDIPAVLKCCAEFIEKRGIVDGIYRLSGITSNIQKLRNLFDEDKTPNLEEDTAIKQDIHAVSSLLKMYFRELPNPLCTYQLYDKFVSAAQASDEERLFRMREVVHELPPPHYRTLEYLMKHLARVAQRSNETGMTPKNMAIVWAPNLIRCKELEAGGVDALKGIGVQAVVTEYLVRHADLIFNDKLPANYSITTTVLSHKASCSASGRPKSLAISSPIRLMSLEEAQDRAKQDDRKYIEVGGGPSSLPPKYHTVIDLPSRRSALKNKRSPIGWRQFFSRNRSFSKPSSARKPIEITVMTKSMPMAGPQGIQTNWAGRLRPVKSVESLVSSPMYTTNGATTNGTGEHGDHHHHTLDHESVLEDVESSLSKSSPATPVMTDVDVLFHAAPHHPQNESTRSLIQNPKTHNRSISHDSYFEFGEFRNSNRVYIDETLEEETLSQSSKLSLEISSGGESPTRKSMYAKDSTKGNKSSGRGGGMMSPVTPPPSAASLVVPSNENMLSESVTSTSSDDVVSEHYATPKSPLLPSKWRDSEVQTSQTKLYDVGVCTQEDMEQCTSSSNDVGCGVVSSSTTAIFASSGQRTTTTTSTSCDVTRDSSAQSLISHSSSGGDNIYELDRNSSVEESSVDSTPCEPFATTNIIYSPLVDDLSSPASSGDHFKAGVDPFRVSSDSEASSTNAKNGSRLYICPLYEAGVSTVESLSSAVSGGTETTDVSSTMSVSPRVNPPRNNQYENVSVINTNKPHNLQVFLCSSSQSLNTPTNHEEPSPVGHVYENQRFYENQPPPVPAIRKSRSEGAVMMTSLNVQKQTSPQQQTSVTPQTPVAVTNVRVEPEEPIYDKEHYENINEIEVKSGEESNSTCADNGRDNRLSHRESNIYEDIDESDDDDELNTGNKYETVEFEKGIMKTRPSPIQVNSEDEYEKVQESPVTIHHHYAEIEERMDTTSVSPDLQQQQEQDKQVSTTTVVIGPSSPQKDEVEEETVEEISSGATSTIPIKDGSVESSPSHSHTEDMVTYLEVQTPHLHLRNNSLDSQEEISQQSSSGGSKLDKTNSRDSSDSPSRNSPAADEGEIRHIDSPVSSPIGSAPAAGVNNPLYGVEGETIPTVDTKDMEMQSDDGEEDMSVNESLSISISMEESPKTKKVEETEKSTGMSAGGMKLVSRCNSAPLAVGVHEFTVALDRSADDGVVNGAGGDDDNEDDVFHKTRTPATRSNSSALGGQANDEIEKRFGEKILLCKRLSEPSLLFSNQNINNASCLMMAAVASSQKTDSSNNNSTGSNGGGANPAAWKIADAKRLANRKQSVRELLSKFESRDSNSTPSPVQSPPSSLPPTGLITTSSNNKDAVSFFTGGRSPSNNSINSSNTGSGRFQHHRFSTGDILMTQSVSAVENLSSIPASAGGSLPGVQNSNSLIVRSDTLPELSRDDSASKENALHGGFSIDRNSDDSGPEKNALRVAMSSVDMNDPSRRERIEKYKEERRSFLRQKISSELTAQQKSPTEGGAQQIVSLKSPVSEVPESESFSVPNNRTSESPRKRAFSEDGPINDSNNTTNKSIKTDPFSLKCAFLASSTTTTSSTKVKETSISSVGGGITETVSSSTSMSSTKSVETAEEINVRERVALWSSTSQQQQKKDTQQIGTGGGQRIHSTTSSLTSLTTSSSITSTVNSNNTSLVTSAKLSGALSTSTTEFPKVSKPLLRRELTTSAIEVSKNKLTKVGRTNSEGTKKIKDMAAFFEAKQF